MSQINQNIPTFQCVIIGHAGCGKTSLIQRLLTGDFDQNYKPTRGVKESRLIFHTNRGPICFNVWETVGLKQNYNQVHCALILYDLSTESYEAVPKLAFQLSRTCPNIPVAVCANKFEHFSGTSEIWNLNVKLMMSVKLNYNVAKPFLWLARQLFADPQLRLVPNTAEMPPYVPISRDQQMQMLSELPQLPQEDEDDN